MPFKTHKIGERDSILLHGTHYTYDALRVRVSDTGIVPNADGRKIVPKGTIVGGNTSPVIEAPNEVVVEKNGATSEGVLLLDVDVTGGEEFGAMVTRGYIDLDKMPTAPTAAVKTALPNIIFGKKK